MYCKIMFFKSSSTFYLQVQVLDILFSTYSKVYKNDKIL